MVFLFYTSWTMPNKVVVWKDVIEEALYPRDLSFFYELTLCNIYSFDLFMETFMQTVWMDWWIKLQVGNSQCPLSWKWHSSRNWKGEWTYTYTYCKNLGSLNSHISKHISALHECKRWKCFQGKQSTPSVIKLKLHKIQILEVKVS